MSIVLTSSRVVSVMILNWYLLDRQIDKTDFVSMMLTCYALKKEVHDRVRYIFFVLDYSIVAQTSTVRGIASY